MTKSEKMFAITGVINYIFVVFLNAFTDLGHKIIIQNTIFKVYDGDTQIILTAIVNALILFPYILIFSPSGFLADRFPKNKIMEYSAAFAVVITLGITYSYYNGLFYLAFGLTFMLALQSAIYAPAKYGYIKELVGVKFISAGNGAVQATTTVAILGGIIVYTVLFESFYDETMQSKESILQAMHLLGWLLVFGSVVEWALASKLPNKMLEVSQRSFKFKRYFKGIYLRKNINITKRKKEIFEDIIALSLFWSISQVVLAIFGEYAKSKLGVTNTIFVQGVMALAGIGIVIGSIISAKLSKYYINTGLAPLGAFSIMLLVFLIPFIESMPLLAIVFTLFGISAGFLMVPLNAQIQFLSARVHLGTILAGNNFIQNIFMFSFLVLTTIFAYFGMNSIMLFYAMGFVGFYLLYVTFKRYSTMTFWAIMQMIAKFRYKINYEGLENIPQDKAVLLLGNHVSWLDWIIIQLPIQRQISFLIDKEIYQWPVANRLFKIGQAIPLSQRASKDALQSAYARLKAGRIVALFPEGEIAKTAELGEFRKGYELIPTDYDGVIVPFFIDGLFGSSFSKYKPNEKQNIFKKRVVTVTFGKAIAKETKVDELKQVILDLKEANEVK